MVERAHALDGAVGERHRQRAVARVELGRRAVQRAVGERALLEHATDDGVGGARARGRRSPSMTPLVVGPRHRPLARRLHGYELELVADRPRLPDAEPAAVRLLEIRADVRAERAHATRPCLGGLGRDRGGGPRRVSFSA